MSDETDGGLVADDGVEDGADRGLVAIVDGVSGIVEDLIVEDTLLTIRPISFERLNTNLPPNRLINLHGINLTAPKIGNPHNLLAINTHPGQGVFNLNNIVPNRFGCI